MPLKRPLSMLSGLLACASLAHAATSAANHDWRFRHGDAGGSHYSPLRQINRDNVHRLKPAWLYRCDDAGGGNATTIQCNPLVIDGVLYGSTPGLKVFALDARSGAVRWIFDPWNGARGRGVNRGFAWWEGFVDDPGALPTSTNPTESRSDGQNADAPGSTAAAPQSDNADARRVMERRLFFAAGPLLYALDAATGKPIPSFGRNGRIDLREGLDQDAFYLGVNAPTPGIVYRDLLILGSAIPDGPPPTAPGHIRAFDVRTGERRWIFHTIPHPGEFGYETWSPDAWQHNGGANSWGGVTLDTVRGLVFFGTGSANYDHYGGDRPGMNLFANCTLALDAATGQRRWHFQIVHHDLWDYDLPCAPVLVTVGHGGRRIDAVVQVTKTGHAFVFDRETGIPLFPVEERPVPASDIPGEKSWPTQPFPLKPPPFARQGLTIDDATDLDEDARRAVMERLRGMRSEGLFTPPSTNPTVVMPQFNGGAEWGGPAVDPERGWLFVNASNEPEWIQMFPARPKTAVSYHELGGHLHRALCSNCHGAGRTDLPAVPALQSLREVRQRLSPEQVMELLETGRGQMPSFTTLSRTEREAIVAFLFDRRDAGEVKMTDADLAWANRIPWIANGHPELRDPNGYPASRRPWGTLTAIDLNEGSIAWQVPLGTYPELEKRGLPPTGTFNIGGPIATAGGLVFIGATMDERFRAFDADTGRVLWEYQLDAGAYATPATYMIDGQQFVVIAAGGGGKPGTRSGNGWWCFTLDASAQREEP